MIQTKQSHSILTSEFEEEMDHLTGTHIRENNSIKLLPSGAESYKMRWQLIEEAQKNIHIVAFSLMLDSTSKRLRDLVCAKSKAGVAARLIFDDAVLYSTFSGMLLRDMEKAGAEVIRYNKIFRDLLPNIRKGHPFRQLAQIFRLKLKRRFHEKYLIVDGSRAVLGGINWGNKYAFGGIRPKAWRDSDVYLTGPVVGDIQNQFVRDLFLYKAMDSEYHLRKEPGFDRSLYYKEVSEQEKAFKAKFHKELFPKLLPTGDKRIRYIPHKPYDEERLRLTHAYLLLFREARKYIFWGCHGIRPPRIIAETLIEAAKRGVDIRLITNCKKSSRTLMLFGLLGWMYFESSNHFRHLIENGIKVYEWQKPGAFHSKNMVIDDVVASVGSYNIARGSTFHHTESNVIVSGSDFPLKVREQFEIDLKDCKQISLEEAKKPMPFCDPYKRLLHPRNKLIDESLLTEIVCRDLKEGRYKHRKY